MWESCCLKCIFGRSLKKKACMLIITMIRKIQKPISTVQELCIIGSASGALITVIWNCSMLIRHSLLHFEQKSGKFFSTVSSRILSRVLFPQTGQRTRSTLTFICTSTFYFFLEYPITLTKYDATTIPKAKIVINIGFLTKF